MAYLFMPFPMTLEWMTMKVIRLLQETYLMQFDEHLCDIYYDFN